MSERNRPADAQIQTSLAPALVELVDHLARYLEDVLPRLFDDWWEEAVLGVLSYQQRQRATRGQFDSLISLDLAALLRVFDQNWYQISSAKDLGFEARNYVKEMLSVRNRWAHATAKGCSRDDMYRDLDTLQRFGAVIEADEAFLERVTQEKQRLLAAKAPSSRQVVSPEPAPAATSEFALGQMVISKANPAVPGAVIEVIPGEPETRYRVFMDGERKTFYASQLVAAEQERETRHLLSSERFHAYLTALQIKYPALSTLYSLNAARIDFIPYQFRPVLKFIRSDRPRLLIADGVGVGKTIEAGLILRELQARRDIRSVLIVCPRPLVTERKWQNEMRRFEERFTHLDGGTLRYCIGEMDLEGVWPEQYQRAILPYSLFDEALLYGSGTNNRRKRRKGLLDLDPPPRFDLVIVDEAHHIRNQDTYNHKGVRFFCDHAEAVVFLTATPIQLGSHDLYVLLNVLRPDLVIDEHSFEHMAEPNPHINQAVAHVRAQDEGWVVHAREALERAASTPWGRSVAQLNPAFREVASRLQAAEISPDERIQLITDIEELHTFSRIINRTRRRDIGEFAIRKPETVVVEFAPAQRQLHDDLLAVQAGIFARLHGDINVKFMMTTIRRQAASCLYGLVPLLEEILSRHLDELAWSEADSLLPTLSTDSVDRIEGAVQEVLARARELDPYDPKLEALLRIIRDKQTLPNNRVMLFSGFRHTLHYLHKHLGAQGLRVGLVHGGTPDAERVEMRNRFQAPRDNNDAIDVLLFSEIGCEGLDYQFCDCIVNYDLPWNPMRIEQRIGRIDRNGQKSETVAIVNLITPGTVDADIYERCLTRIGVFDRALGASEEILGDITREIRNIAENLDLTEMDRRKQLQQLADNKIRLIQEQDELEERQLELFGIRLPEDQMRKEIAAASSFWLGPHAIERLVNLYLRERCGEAQEFILGEKPLKTLRLSQEARSRLHHDLEELPRQTTPSYREWERWLKGGNPHLSITFDPECATKHPEAVFVMPVHPLVRQAAMSLEKLECIETELAVATDRVPPERYAFAIYQWQFAGIREDLVLRPIASSQALTPHLAALLEIAEDAAEDGQSSMDQAAPIDQLDAMHYELWSQAREEHKQRVANLADYRRESLTTSHQARMALLQEQLSQADDERIQRMRRAQIAAAETDYARRIQELDIAQERADVVADAIAYGWLQVKEGDPDGE